MMTRLQLFIHRYYDQIKMAMLFLNLLAAMILLILLLNQMITNDYAARERAAAVTDILESIKESDKRQTEQLEQAIDTLSRQNRALCVVIIEVTGQEGLNKLDDETRAKCQSLGQRTSAAMPPVIAPEQPQTARSEQEESSAPPDPSRAQTRPTAPVMPPQPPPQPQPTPPQQQGPGAVQRTLDGTTGLIRSVIERIGL